ncbi:hypothetical protein [Paenibacillus sabinae]|uniref:hypothetical protein n=1 Tax=Paenibacillus sabinae TaxID=365617 RepID=UPI00130E2610|nr:hypothetical protein [Paenibacillus sabinae]
MPQRTVTPLDLQVAPQAGLLPTKKKERMRRNNPVKGVCVSRHYLAAQHSGIYLPERYFAVRCHHAGDAV